MTNAHFSVCKDHLLVASYANVAGQGGTDGHVFMGVVAVWNSRALFGPNMYVCLIQSHNTMSGKDFSCVDHTYYF